VDQAVDKKRDEEFAAHCTTTDKLLLSKTALQRFHAPAKGKRRIWDSEITGLYVSLPASGNAVAYFRYRINNIQRDFRIGRIDRLSFKVIRETTRKLAAKVELGFDPQLQRKEEKQRILDEQRQEESNKRSTLGNFYNNYYADHAKAYLKNSHRCLRAIEMNFGQWFEWPMEEITVSVVCQWRNQQMNTPVVRGKDENRTETPRKPGGVNRPVSYLRALLSIAYEEAEVIDHHPLAKLKPLKEPKNPCKRFLKEDEYRRLRNTLRGREDYLPIFIELGLHTGLRTNEMLTLTWDNINFDERTLLVESQYAKSKRTRTVPLNDTIIAMLREWKFRIQRFGPWVFTNPETGNHYVTVKRAWDAAMKKANIKDFVRHDLRRTFGSWLAESGESIYVIKNLLGHSTVQVTEGHYAYLQDESQRNAVTKIEVLHR